MAERANTYRHVVLFKFKDTASAETVAGIEDAFRAFCASLPFVTDFEWGLNSSPEGLNEGFTHCFIVTFAAAGGTRPVPAASRPSGLHRALARPQPGKGVRGRFRRPGLRRR